MTTRQRTLLTLIMVMAAFLRAEYLLQIEHNVDHAYPVWQALQTLDRGAFPLTGQGTSVLFANPPLTGYLFLPVIALTRSPLGAYILVVALNTLAVLLAYRTARLIVGGDWALVAALLMAVNPWVIEYSRTSWVQSLLPFGVCALTWALFPVLLGAARHPARRLVLACVILTALAQTYLLAFALVVPVGVLILIFWRRVPRRALGFGAVVFLIAAALYGVGLLQQSAAVQARLSAFGANPAHLSAEALNHALRLVTGSDYAIARGTLAPIADSALRQELSSIAHIVLVAALVLGVLAALARIVRKSAARDRAIITLVWFALPILMMSYVGQVIHPFYQLLGIPAGYVLAAWGFAWGFKAVAVWAQRAVRLQRRPFLPIGIVLVLLAPFAVLMGINSARYYQDTAVTPGIDGLSALPLGDGLRLGAAIREGLPATVYADTDEWILSSFSGRTLDFVRDARAPQFNIVPPSGLYVTLSKAGEPEAAPLGVDMAERITLADGSSITVDHLSASAVQPTMSMNIPSDQGIAFLGYTLDHVDDQWTLTTYWRVDARVEGIDGRLFAPFAHVFDTDGTRILIVDGQAVPGYEWRVADMHAHRMTFTLAAGTPFTISVGQYDAGSSLNAVFVLPSGEYTPLIPLEEPAG